MRLFLDSSALLAACGSSLGATHEIFRLAPHHGWNLVATPYVIGEVESNLPLLFPENASWPWLRSKLLIVENILTIDLPSVFPVAKDRPILFSALAWTDVLLTLDKNDFGTLLGTHFYGLAILTPGDFLRRERASGRI